MTTITAETIAKLARELTSEDLNDRFDAASLIGTHRVTGAADLLVARIGVETDRQVNERITWAAVQILDATLPGVLAKLDSDDPAARAQAAHVLSKTGRAEFADRLVALVEDENTDVAIKGYRAAANTGEPSVLPVLANRLGDGDAMQRDALTNALVSFGEESVASLTEALSHPDVAVRAHAAEALGHLGAEADAALDALVAATADDDASVRQVATSALGQLGPVADAALAQVAGGNDPQLAAIASSLQQSRATLRKRQAQYAALRQANDA